MAFLAAPTITAPAPAPAPSGGGVSSLLGDPNALGSSGSSKYGLGQWGSAKFTPQQLGSLGAILGLQSGGSADDVVARFAAGTPSAIAQVQQWLSLGGFYSSTYKPTLGIVRPEDINAFGNAVTTVAQSQSQAAQTPGSSSTDLTSYLQNTASVGQQQGLEATLAARKLQVSLVQHPDPNQSGDVIDKVAQSVLGRKLDPAEKDALVKSFNDNYVGAQKASVMQQLQADASTADSSQQILDTVNGNPTGALPAAQSGPDLSSFDRAEQPTTGGTNPNGSYLQGIGQAAGSNIASRADNSNDPYDRAEAHGNGGGGQTNADLNAFVAAIGSQESGSDPNTPANALTGAQGQFQILPSNWPSWAREAGLGSDAPKTTANQQLVAKFKLGQYYAKYHDWGIAAVAWYAGDSTAAAYARNPNSTAWTAPQAGGPSIQGYRDSVLSRLSAQPIAGDTGASGFAGPISPGSAAGGNGVQFVDVTSPDLQADTEAAIKKAHPQEAAAHDIAGTFANFLGIINNPTSTAASGN